MKQTCAKNASICSILRKLSAISLVLEIFRRLNAISIALYTPNDMHTVFGVERSRPVRKMRSFTQFWRKLTVISLLLEIFRRLNIIFIAFYTPIAMHAVFGVETSATVRQIWPFTPFWRKLSVISLVLEIFRRLNALSIALYTPNATYAAFSDETSPIERQMRPYTRFWRKLCVISVLLEIFRRLNAI